MAIRFMDAVTGYGKDQLLSRWDGVLGSMRVEYSVWSPKGALEGTDEPSCTGAGRFTSEAIVWAKSYGGFISKVLPPSTSDFHIISFNLLLRSWTTTPKFVTDPTNVRTGVLATLTPEAGPSGRTTLTLALSDTGVLTVFLGGWELFVGGSEVLSFGGVKIDEWMQIDVALKIGTTDGFVKMYHEGIQVAETNPMDTKSLIFDTVTPVGSFSLRQPATFQGRFDEIFIQDGSGTTNNEHLGRVHVKRDLARALDPITNFVDGGGVQATRPLVEQPKTGALQVINEIRVGNRSCKLSDIDLETPGVFKGDEEHMESSNSGDRLVVNGPADAGTLALQVSVNSRKTSSDDTSYEFIAKTNSQEFPQDLVSVTDSYDISTTIYNSDPRDDSVWDQTKLIDFNWGIKKV